jgi:Domain of unknown function (DUF4395)
VYMLNKRFAVGEVGVVIPGLMLHGKPAPYHVINERAIRAGAGITFAAGLFSFFHAFYLHDFTYLKMLVPVLFIDFFAKVILGTRYSPLSRLSAWIVRSQTPEYVGAVQKRFAWSIGLALSTTMLLLLFVFGISGLPNLIICGLCLTFMFAESAFGICVGCKIYQWLLKRGIIAEPEHRPACPGNVCAIQ